MAFYDDQFIPALTCYIEAHPELCPHDNHVKRIGAVTPSKDHVAVWFTMARTEVSEHINIPLSLLDLLKEM